MCIALQGGPIQKAGERLHEAAIGCAFMATKRAKQMIKWQLETVAGDPGRHKHYSTLDDCVNGLRAKYPFLKLTAAHLDDLKKAFMNGRQTGAKRRDFRKFHSCESEMQDATRVRTTIAPYTGGAEVMSVPYVIPEEWHENELP